LEVSFRESDLLICTDKKIEKGLAEGILKKYYAQIEEYIEKNPLFLKSLSPIKTDNDAPAIIQGMIESSKITGVGPFASVAGAIAFYVGRELLDSCKEVIVENGGDIFLKIGCDKRLGVYLGENSTIKNISLKIKTREYTFGIASSSSTIGHSLNFGKADLLTVIAKDAVLADSFATALSNRIKKEVDVKEVLEFAKNSKFIEGVLVYFAGKIFLWGQLELE